MNMIRIRAGNPAASPFRPVSGGRTERAGPQRRRQRHRPAAAGGAQLVEIDLGPFPEAGRLPYDAMLADPIRLNARLGRYTTFANLLDLAAVAVPTRFAAGLPFGVTLLAPAGHYGILAGPAEFLHRSSGLPVGAGAHPLLTA
ncbi:hypothetical protein CC117_18125 [Parafrankia colletiae]|uniref:Amidase domain-containing protein n=1 Tax=Parafrankia colletiae TaxID=573497 RepID=A0A1S1QRH4_9ACTN|nr:hypothetical protein [Parafrankia colletiae]MCK9901401.1 hypothetical protein [Frankia sp. Cpl3]OHV36307.1 hypothetical protein CC117_18125 [Parafrankia colletiae]